MGDIYLTLHTMPDGSSTSVAVSLVDALAWEREDFVKLYLKTMYGAKKAEARAWADDQIAQRASVA